MAAKHTLSEALKTIRKARGLSQEAFSDVSSRTYMSSLERDLKSPTLNKLAELCEVMEVHPLTLLTLAYAGDDAQRAEQLLAQVRQELEAMPSTLASGLLAMAIAISATTSTMMRPTQTSSVWLAFLRRKTR